MGSGRVLESEGWKLWGMVRFSVLSELISVVVFLRNISFVHYIVILEHVSLYFYLQALEDIDR